MTDSGRQFLASAFFVTLLGAIFRFAAVEFLGLALTISAFISFLMLRLSKDDISPVPLEEKKIRVFKYEEATLNLHPASSGIPWTVHAVREIRAPEGVNAEAKFEDGILLVSVRALYAGRFEGFEVGLEFTDPLRLFYRLRYIVFPLVVESLPLSLLGNTRNSTTGIFSTGERPSGRRGMGHELYSVEDYSHYSLAKDIMWKRVAKQTDEKIVVGVREASTPEVIAIEIVEQDKMEQSEKRLVWADLVSEAVCRLALAAISSGSRVRMYSSRGCYEVNTERDISEAIMSIWKGERKCDNIANAQIRVVPLKNADKYINGKSKILVIPDDGDRFDIQSPDAMIFTGVEEIEVLIERVMI
jgi:hypothetical protein